MRPMRVWSTLALVACSCASVQPATFRTDPSEAFDATELALIASGYESAEGLALARLAFERKVTPILAGIDPREPPEVRAWQLIRALHGRSVLKTYDARATTLREIIDEGRFNCVSAATLFNLLAERRGLNVVAELLPTHARSLVLLDDDRIVVEPTSIDGFEPDPNVQAQLLRLVQGDESDGERTTVSTLGLLSAMYVNRASIAQEAGDIDRAERLVARAQAMAEGWDLRVLLRGQRAALLAQLASDDLRSNQPSRIQRAFATLRSAAMLQPEDERIAQAVSTSLRAATERLLVEQLDQAESIDELLDGSVRWLTADDQAGLMAFALSQRAVRSIDHGDLVEALALLESALSIALADSDKALRATIEENQISALRLSALAWAERGEYDTSMALIARVRHLAEERGAELPPFVKSDQFRALNLIGLRWLDERRYERAAEVLREGLKLDPTHAITRHNLRVALERQIAEGFAGGVCDQGSLDELATLDVDALFVTKARARCLSIEADAAFTSGDDARAALLLRTAHEVSPDSKVVEKNLRLVLAHRARSLAAAGECHEVEKIVAELRRLEDTTNIACRMR